MARLFLIQELDQIGSGPGHSRADGSDRALTNSGRLLVGKTQDLGQHERFPSVRA